MLKKLTIILTTLSVLLTSVGPILPQTAYASENNDALVKTILKAAASAAAGKLAELVAEKAAVLAKTKVQDKGEAAVPTVSTNEVPVKAGGVETIAANIHSAGETQNAQTFLQWVESFAKTVIQKAVLDVVVDQIITYIQGGGKPQFVTDWQGFLEDAGQRATGEFVKSLGLGFVCEPFNLQLQIALGGKPKKFSEEATCTLDKIVGNIQNFTNDFRNGGWIAYGESWKVQNNFLGSLITSQEKLGRTQEAAVLAKLNEAVAGKGFTSPKKCQKDVNNPQAANLDEQAAALDQQANALQAASPGNAQALRNQASQLRQQAAGLRSQDLQSTCKIVTPGSTLGDLTSKAVGKDIDFLLNADQLGDYVAAIVDALLNRVIDEGLAAAETKSR